MMSPIITISVANNHSNNQWPIIVRIIKPNNCDYALIIAMIIGFFEQKKPIISPIITEIIIIGYPIVIIGYQNSDYWSHHWIYNLTVYVTPLKYPVLRLNFYKIPSLAKILDQLFFLHF